uniref:Uncharacterized protein n=1 Tax=Salix viminalis TaxID=40686 RepID=A0A6N2M7Z2_SALVM
MLFIKLRSQGHLALASFLRSLIPQPMGWARKQYLKKAMPSQCLIYLMIVIGKRSLKWSLESQRRMDRTHLQKLPHLK